MDMELEIPGLDRTTDNPEGRRAPVQSWGRREGGVRLCPHNLCSPHGGWNEESAKSLCLGPLIGYWWWKVGKGGVNVGWALESAGAPGVNLENSQLHLLINRP